MIPTLLSSEPVSRIVPLVILLNGTSSSGKSSIVQACREMVPLSGMASVSVDQFVDLLPASLVGEAKSASAGFSFFRRQEMCMIEAGPIGDQLIRSMHGCVTDLASLGVGSIVDHVLLKHEWFDHLSTLLQQRVVRLVTVLVTCDDETLCQRERKRGDRRLGLAKGLRIVEKSVPAYDLTIDTTYSSPAESAQKIWQQVQRNI